MKNIVFITVSETLAFQQQRYKHNVTDDRLTHAKSKMFFQNNLVIELNIYCITLVY